MLVVYVCLSPWGVVLMVDVHVGHQREVCQMNSREPAAAAARDCARAYRLVRLSF
jgi:hypothetical protein